jgi:hypothetical protein
MQQPKGRSMKPPVSDRAWFIAAPPACDIMLTVYRRRDGGWIQCMRYETREDAEEGAKRAWKTCQHTHTVYQITASVSPVQKTPTKRSKKNGNTKPASTVAGRRGRAIEG